MMFLVDAQLPRRLAVWLHDHGHDALHTLDLSAGNRTTDAEVLALAACEQRAVITKDDDFVRSFHASLRRVAAGSSCGARLKTAAARLDHASYHAPFALKTP